MALKEIDFDVDWIQLALDRVDYRLLLKRQWTNGLKREIRFFH